ncbi:EamA-like transporter family protein [Roseivivax sp. THAF40]|uniref:DMT family transporter n=1 Tax=unclassified Roseivivax TaxID=2639302 RepID=UPI00126857A7|nr:MULTISPECIES: DMT family transporter [unclassified Roseivivax]QFS83137.1 EamA-like transporter family protein [Roseivivax sp. THAF197b]QFT46881.1 EamA-like transporter family protein [Roseivivax sp. THAF40]
MKLCATHLGGLFVALYTLQMAAADSITKFIAGQYAAPQLFALAAFIAVGLSLIVARRPAAGGVRRALSTGQVGAMTVRSVLTVIASIAFFYAFRYLPFADVFLFMALVPVVAAILSGPFLGEPIRPTAWLAVILGVGGLLCLMPEGPSSLSVGHCWAGLAVLSGTGSLVAARYIGQRERSTLAQVFYPNLALFLTMALALPFLWQPMSAMDLAWVTIYALILFVARWTVTAAMGLLPAYVATPLMNLQFVWMVLIGFLAFGEIPSVGTLAGVSLVIGSGLWLVIDNARPKWREEPVAT